MGALLALDPQYLSHIGLQISPSVIRGVVGIQGKTSLFLFYSEHSWRVIVLLFFPLCSSGIYDLIQLDADFPDYKNYFTEFAFGDSKENWRKASPQFVVPTAASKGISFLLLHSTEDELVNPIQTERFAKHLQENLPQVRSIVGGNLKGTHWKTIENVGTESDTFSQHILEFVKKS
jgi:hypothetical protein